MEQTLCSQCDRGGNGNAKDKCSCGWQVTADNGLGCFLGTPITGEIKPVPKLSKAKQRYRRFLEYGDMFNTFIDFCRWDAMPDKSWNLRFSIHKQ